MNVQARDFNTVFLMILATGTLAICSCNSFNAARSTTRPTIADNTFQTLVKPLLEHRCVWCHGNEITYGGLNFQNRTATLDPESRFVVPGDPESSRIYVAVTRDPDHDKAMPGDGWGATTEQKRALYSWIKSGAPWPANRNGTIKRRPYQVLFEDYL